MKKLLYFEDSFHEVLCHFMCELRRQTFRSLQPAWLITFIYGSNYKNAILAGNTNTALDKGWLINSAFTIKELSEN
jgi:hypothetical protein